MLPLLSLSLSFTRICFVAMLPFKIMLILHYVIIIVNSFFYANLCQPRLIDVSLLSLPLLPTLLQLFTAIKTIYALNLWQ